MRSSQTFRVLAWEMSSEFNDDMIPSLFKQFQVLESASS